MQTETRSTQPLPLVRQVVHGLQPALEHWRPIRPPRALTTPAPASATAQRHTVTNTVLGAMRRERDERG